MKFPLRTRRVVNLHHRILILLACIFAIGGPASASSAVSATDVEVRNETIVRRAFEEWQAGGSVFKLLAPDVVWTIVGSGPAAGTYHGVEDFVQRGSRPLVSRLATPLRPRVHHIWATQDKVIIRFDASATTISGTPYNNQFLWIFRMESGSVVEAEAFLDLAAYQQVIDNNEPRDM